MGKISGVKYVLNVVHLFWDCMRVIDRFICPLVFSDFFLDNRHWIKGSSQKTYLKHKEMLNFWSMYSWYIFKHKSEDSLLHISALD